eukprot:3246390-Lingulodinium_polyedra.AAC.1
MDEGSVGIAAWWFMAHHLPCRTLLVKDIFHRQWNDAQMAIRGSGLWWVVLLTTMAYNLCYGPWEGSGWFSKVVDGAREYFGKERTQSPLFQA